MTRTEMTPASAPTLVSVPLANNVTFEFEEHADGSVRAAAASPEEGAAFVDWWMKLLGRDFERRHGQ